MRSKGIPEGNFPVCCQGDMHINVRYLRPDVLFSCNVEKCFRVGFFLYLV